MKWRNTIWNYITSGLIIVAAFVFVIVASLLCVFLFPILSIAEKSLQRQYDRFRKLVEEGYFHIIAINNDMVPYANEWLAEHNLEYIYVYRQKMPKNLDNVTVVAPLYGDGSRTGYHFVNKSTAVLFKLVFG